MARQAARLSLNQKLALNGSLATSIRVLRFDTSGLTRYLEEQASENPYLTLGPPVLDPANWLPRWTTAFAAQGMGQAGSHDIGEMLQAPAIGLIAHVSQEIKRLITDPQSLRIAFALMEALEPSGWLGRPLAAIAAEAGFSQAEAERVLAVLQTMEPTGIFARSLAECLRLQAVEAEVLDPVMACVLAHLDVLATGDIAQLARLCAVSDAEVVARLRVIRGFDPKPGAQYVQDAAPVREPDLTVSRGATGWAISLNRSALPDLQINASPEGGATDAKALAAARDLQRVVANRNQTLLRIGQEILTRQEAVLTRGMEALQPMTLQDVAKPLDLHVSTVSRAIAGVAVDAPRGTIWLRALFTSSLGGEGGAASGAVRARLLKLIQNEDGLHPQSDQALAEALSSKQSPVARRTVAKYRAGLGIPPAHRRKQRPAPL